MKKVKKHAEGKHAEEEGRGNTLSSTRNIC